MAGAVARTAEIIDDDLRAASRQFERISAAEAAARAGDDGDAVLEADGHHGAPDKWLERFLIREQPPVSRRVACICRTGRACRTDNAGAAAVADRPGSVSADWARRQGPARAGGVR